MDEAGRQATAMDPRNKCEGDSERCGIAMQPALERRGSSPSVTAKSMSAENKSAPSPFTRPGRQSILDAETWPAVDCRNPLMDASPEFLKFTSQFHQDIFDIHESADEALGTALGGLSKQEQGALRSFLISAIASDASNDQLLELWNSAQSEFYLSESSQARDFFTRIVSRISP